jgi:hypothetical protein
LSRKKSKEEIQIQKNPMCFLQTCLMSEEKEELRKLVSSWAKQDASKTELWLRIISEQDIDHVEALRSLQPNHFLSILENIRSRALLCQKLEDWYRSQFPNS